MERWRLKGLELAGVIEALIVEAEKHPRGQQNVDAICYANILRKNLLACHDVDVFEAIGEGGE
jgi:hypothetical protein